MIGTRTFKGIVHYKICVYLCIRYGYMYMGAYMTAVTGTSRSIENTPPLCSSDLRRLGLYFRLRTAMQLHMALTGGRDGGLFVMIWRRRP